VIKPRALRSGDRIGIVSPASGCDRAEFERGVVELRRLGYEPVYDDSVFETSMFTAGSAASRAAAFRRAWADPTISAIMAARGGYGSVQLLPLFDGWYPEETPKLFIGYSDNTSLLSWLTCDRGVASVYGPMIEGRLAKGTTHYHSMSFLSLVQGLGAGMEMAPDGLTVLKAGEAEGPLFGGTLTQLAGSMGTPYAFNPPDGCILLVEDVSERPYRIDRMLMQLRLSGVLSKARALVFGEMPGCDEPGGAITARDAIRSFTADVPGPVIVGFPAGHTVGPCWTLPLGVRVSVQTTPTALLRVEESPVA
jgi:muramoyltetrapeptide carboxypeptidase